MAAKFRYNVMHYGSAHSLAQSNYHVFRNGVMMFLAAIDSRIPPHNSAVVVGRNKTLNNKERKKDSKRFREKNEFN